jgi:2-polyprenyl-3-methyl-5-hydroxy-6-metoxy-1,4-benzoquinol methylase
MPGQKIASARYDLFEVVDSLLGGTLKKTLKKSELDALCTDIRRYAATHGGKLYAPVDLDCVKDVPFHHGYERMEAIAPYLDSSDRTALDVGAHWGMASGWLERKGLEVTAAENAKEYLPYLDGIRRASGAEFQVHAGSVFELRPARFDVVLALNIFHHFIKTPALYDTFTSWLGQMQCGKMFVQFHNTEEGQMADAFRNYAPAEFAALIASCTGLHQITRIADFGKRPLYLLQR